jgi:crotonobetainyl-CoA:carnitine CoA-transferase CaiB-like acyl-CoA transferase
MLQPDVYWDGLCRAIGRDDLLDDPRFADPAARVAHSRDIVGELDRTFLAHPLDHWRAALSTQRGQWDVVQRSGDLVEDPMAVANAYIQTVTYPGGHTLPLVSTPIRFDREAPALSAAPELSGDAEGILASLGWDEERIIEAKISGAVV